MLDALAKFDVANPTIVHIIASGERRWMDEALARLVAWLPHTCEAVNSVHFESQPDDVATWDHIRDDHVTIFRNAAHVHVSNCECITDQAFLAFTCAESMNVSNCASIRGSFVNSLVAHHRLRRLVWNFTQRTAPLQLIAEPPRLLIDALTVGALKLSLSLWRGRGRSCWGGGLVLRSTPEGHEELASMATAIARERSSPGLQQVTRGQPC